MEFQRISVHACRTGSGSAAAAKASNQCGSDVLQHLVPHPLQELHSVEDWIELSTITVEVTSENPGHTVERCLLHDSDEGGWRAGEPGVQTIRLLFDQAQDVHRIFLCFVETSAARTQEFAIRWSDGTDGLKEIVRQQWNFSPNGATSEIEDYDVSLKGVRVLELTINPDIKGADAYASITRLRLA